jgi:hypothetical protein
MEHITRGMAAAVLNELPTTFDTHQIERRTLRLFTVEFAEELLEFRNADDLLCDSALRSPNGSAGRSPLTSGRLGAGKSSPRIWEER